MKTLDEWADERRHVDDLRLEPGWEGMFDQETPAYVYECGFIECLHVGYSLLIEKKEWRSRSLERLEGILYECWVKDELPMQQPGV